METQGFKYFLRGKGFSERTVKAYANYVKKFERYLLKHQRGRRLEEAKQRHIKDFARWARKELQIIYPYLSGIRKYYEYKHKEEMCHAIDEIPRDKSSKSSDLLPWKNFVDYMKKAEEDGIKDRDRALLYLLWSEMDLNDILGLSVLDIDFERQRITSPISDKIFCVTPEAWDALHKYVPTEDRGKDKLLFPGKHASKHPIQARRVQQITKRYFESVKQTPTKLRLSCKADLVEAGKEKRFVYRASKKIDSVPLDEEILEWIDQLIREKRFRDRSHAIEYALRTLRKTVDERTEC